MDITTGRAYYNKKVGGYYEPYYSDQDVFGYSFVFEDGQIRFRKKYQDAGVIYTTLFERIYIDGDSKRDLYDSPESDIVTGIGSGGNIAINEVNRHLNRRHPIIATHYGGVRSRFTPFVRNVGIVGDVFNLSGVGWNIAYDPSNPQHYFDAIAGIIGVVPVYGDAFVLLYTGAVKVANVFYSNQGIQSYLLTTPGAHRQYHINWGGSVPLPATGF